MNKKDIIIEFILVGICKLAVLVFLPSVYIASEAFLKHISEAEETIV